MDTCNASDRPVGLAQGRGVTQCPPWNEEGPVTRFTWRDTCSTDPSHLPDAHLQWPTLQLTHW
jgi:hypothetical protein